VNVRRLFLFLEESLERGTQWATFEPNHEVTWRAVVGNVSNFLTTVWRDGALQGRTADEAFFVRCDRTTMIEDDILDGRLVCLVGVAPVRAAEFVILRIRQLTLPG
jgi:phage tail sheath protein FI